MMNFVELYIGVLITFAIVLIVGFFCNAKARQVFELFENDETNEKVTGISMIQSLFEKNNISDIETTIINNKNTNKYLRKHKVIKLSSYTGVSSTILSVGICASEAGKAVLSTKKKFLFKLKDCVNFIANIISKLYLPLTLILAIINATHTSAFCYYSIFALTIIYSVAFILKIIDLFIDLHLSKFIVAKVRETQFFNSYELEKLTKTIVGLTFCDLSNFAKSNFNFLKLITLNLLD